jgi:hypothetical protein
MRESLWRNATITGALLLFSGAAFAADPAVVCESAKLKEAANYSSCRLKAQAKAVKKGAVPDHTKCESKFADKWGVIRRGKLTPLAG